MINEHAHRIFCSTHPCLCCALCLSEWRGWIFDQL